MARLSCKLLLAFDWVLHINGALYVGYNLYMTKVSKTKKNNCCFPLVQLLDLSFILALAIFLSLSLFVRRRTLKLMFIYIFNGPHSLFFSTIKVSVLEEVKGGFFDRSRPSPPLEQERPNLRDMGSKMIYMTKKPQKCLS